MNWKPPPFLVGAVLVFWGWQTGFFLMGLLLGLALEAPRWVQIRWDFSNDDFRRIWTLSTLLLLAAVVYAFTLNEGPADFLGFFQNPNPVTQREAGTASARTAASIVRWLPMTFFPFIAAQVYSSRGAIPLETVSLILRMRWKKAQQLGQLLPVTRDMDISYFYFVICLFAAAIHPAADDLSYFWGLAALTTWTLWVLRPARFRVTTWAAALVLAIGLGYFGQRGFVYLRTYVEGLNPQWFAHFGRRGFDPTHAKTGIGQLGRVKLSGRIVIRLETPAGQAPPALLREASYRSYKGQSWSADASERDFEVRSAEVTNSLRFVLQPGKTNNAEVKIACYLPGGKALLPLPAGSGVLDNLAVFDLRNSKFGAVLAQGPGLVIFDSRYNQGPTLDSAPNYSGDLDIPSKEEPALERAITEMRALPGDREQAMRKIREFFVEKFNYRAWQDESGRPTRTNETALGRFLLTTRNGHCEYFATATVLLLRKLGFPARYAVGYAVHEGAANRKFVVRQRDAHAWCLVWNERTQTWQDFDTTPGSWVGAEAQRASPFQGLSDAWSRIMFEFSKFRWGQTHLRRYVLWALVPVLLLLLYQIFTRSRRHRRRGREGAEHLSWPGTDSEFYALERNLVKRGFPRQPAEPLSDWLLRLSGEPALAPLQEPLQMLLRLHYRYRFDPEGLSADDRQALRRETGACLRQLAAGPTIRT